MKSLVAGAQNRGIALPVTLSKLAQSLPCPPSPPISAVRVVESLLPDSKVFDQWNFDGGYITGWTQLGINSDGTGSFRGHFHDSGPQTYDYVVTTVLLDVKDAQGNTLAFVHGGTVHGTFDVGGSRDDDWQQDSMNCAIAANWGAAQNSRTWSGIHTHNDPVAVIEHIVEGMLAPLGIVGIVLFGSGVADGSISCRWATDHPICEWGRPQPK